MWRRPARSRTDPGGPGACADPGRSHPVATNASAADSGAANQHDDPAHRDHAPTATTAPTVAPTATAAPAATKAVTTTTPVAAAATAADAASCVKCHTDEATLQKLAKAEEPKEKLSEGEG